MRATARVFVVAVLAGVYVCPSAAQQDVRSAYHKPKYPKVEATLSASLEVADALQASGRPLLTANIDVEIHAGDPQALTAWLTSQGISQINAVGDRIEASLPAAALRELAGRADVLRVSPVSRWSPKAVVNQAVAAHNAANWHAHGFTAASVKVGIIDTFQGYSALIGTELPAPAGARCYLSLTVFTANAADCQTGSNHGTAVAESLVDVAPGAQLYVSNAGTLAQFRSAVDWMLAQGVRVINFSGAFPWDGYGDGTSPSALSALATANAAVAGGAVFVTSAGDEGLSSWLGKHRDADGDNVLDFNVAGNEGNGVQLAAGQTIDVQLRWDDNWAAASRDWELLLVNSSNVPVKVSANGQFGVPGQIPFERLTYTATTAGIYYIVVIRVSGTQPLWFQVQSLNGVPLGIHTGGGIANPAESASPGVLAVGAAAWNTPTVLEDYSSRGPTPDGRIKPDIVAADKADTVIFGGGGFAGTSQASAHVAGLAALVLQAFPAATPKQVADYLKGFASAQGAPVPNSDWGFGFARLPNICTFVFTPSSATVPAGATQATFDVTTQPDCRWTATPTTTFIAIQGSGTGLGNGTIRYSVAANASASARTGAIAVNQQQFSISQQGTAQPTMAADRSSLTFAAVTTPTSFVTATGAQTVRLTQSGPGTVGWAATSNAPWLVVSPASGTGSAALTVSVRFASGLTAVSTGLISINLTGASNAIAPISVRLNAVPNGASAGPVGSFDTPLDGTTGVTGSIAVTGWALDDIQVARVRIERDPVAGEPPGARVYIGDASFVDGVRPDVAGGFGTSPLNSRGGWGYLLLTNFLPNLGNGAFKLYAIADDVDGHSTVLGTKTIVCTNAAATAPFGAIDTPGQGGIVSGIVNNFGWVLSPAPRRADPLHGGTVRVLIDDVVVGSPGGWVSRSDLNALFPEALFPGINNALGVFTFDSTQLTNGVHTIAWLVIDDQGEAAAVGSRFFIVSNGAGLRVLR